MTSHIKALIPTFSGVRFMEWKGQILDYCSMTCTAYTMTSATVILNPGKNNEEFPPMVMGQSGHHGPDVLQALQND
jgi:hypothetical protein